MIDLRRRATDPEGLDLGVSDDEALESLADLRFVNRWLGNRRALWRASAPYLTRPGARLLDVGCGSADVPSWLRGRSGNGVVAVGVDVKPLHLRAAPKDVRGVVADVRRLPFPPRSFDVVTASLFLHHFDGAEVGGVLRHLWPLCRGVLVVNDLQRSAVSYGFGRVAFPLLFRSRVSVADGLVSIRRGFTVRELRDAFAEAGIAPVVIRRCWPYRLLAVAERR